VNLRYLLIALIIVGGGSPANALTERQENQCRYQSVDPGVWTAKEELRTAHCVTTRWPVPGGFYTFSRIIGCESGWNRLANNGGNYLGLAQHSATYWPDRVAHQMPDGWKVGPWQRWTNSRSQIVTTARMVHYSGSWSAWACA
jgi:hypothetical protein